MRLYISKRFKMFSAILSILLNTFTCETGCSIHSRNIDNFYSTQAIGLRISTFSNHTERPPSLTDKEMYVDTCTRQEKSLYCIE